MSAGTKKKVLQCFKQLHYTRLKVFDGDRYALSESRNKINEEFKKQKHVKDITAIEELIKYGNEVEAELRTCVIQARSVEPGKYQAKITTDTIKLENVPFKDVCLEEQQKK